MVSSGIFTNVKRVADVVRAVKDATEATAGPVRVGIYVSEGASTEMVNWVREAFIPQSNSGGTCPCRGCRAHARFLELCCSDCR